jgi:hypothetical protein
MIQFRVSASAAAPESAQVATVVTTSATTPVFSPPLFTFAGCGCRPAGTSFALTLPAGTPDAPQIEAQVSVPETAPAGEKIGFSATVSVASASGSPLTASGRAPAVTVARAPAAPTPASSPKSTAASSAGSASGGSGSGGPGSGGSVSGGSASGGSGAATPSQLGTGGDLGAGGSADAGLALAGVGGLAAVPIGALPVVGSGGPGSTVNVPAGSAANLFPQIKPSPAASQAPKTGPGAQPGQDAVAAGTTSPISLSGAQFGSQIVGLMVLLLGVAVVAVGVSVRKVQAAARPST